MKTIFFLLVTLVTTSHTFAQSNYVSTYLENPNIDAHQLHKLPWDDSRLIQYTRGNVNGYTQYTIDEVSNNVISPIVPPLCSSILKTPVLVDDGILIVGSTSSGIELVYFDEINSTVFDFNPGIDGSDPQIYTLNDHVFIVAFDGAYKQLFEFDKVTHTITQVTNDAISVESVCTVWGNDLFYRTKFSNSLSGEDEYNLMKATPTGSTYSYSLIQNINIPNSTERFVDWRSPQLIWGSLYLMAVDVSQVYSNTNSIGVMMVEPNDQVSTTSLVLPNFVGEFSLIQWNGTLGVYSDLHDLFYTSMDGSTFVSDVVPVNGKLVEYQVSENDKLYFNCLYIDETREIFEYNAGFQSKHVGGHLHFLHEENDILYYTDYSQLDSSSIVLIYTGMDVVDEVMMHLTFHPPHGNSAVIYNGLFTFLFGTDGFWGDSDIFQLTGSPSAGVNELSIDFSAYPNPLSSGESLFLRMDIDGVCEILTADGKVIKQLNLSHGTNVIETSSLSSGVYFVSFMNHTHRIVVN